jgi:RNA-directed DNA polymerase
MMQNGICVRKEQGTPQGGPLSPLLSNIMLHELDKELEKRGHRFCRYADDCNIYLRSEASGKRVLESITHFIEKRLKLKVNKTKSAVDKVSNRKFLGFRLRNNGDISIAAESLKRFKDKIRAITKRNRDVKLDLVIRELNRVTRGWYHYYKCSNYETIFRQLDAWIRRRLRCFRIKQRKRKYSIMTFLRSLGINQQKCWALAGSDKGWWKKALNPVAHQALSNKWFKGLGLFSLYESFVKDKLETAVCDIARTVV